MPHVLTRRTGGVSERPYRSLNLGLHVGDHPALVLENRRRLALRHGLDPEALTFAEQVHGAAVATVGPGERGRGARDHAGALPGVDALVTATPGLPLAVLGADCLLVLLADREAGAIGAAHAGWRGLAAGVLEATLLALDRLGTRRARIAATLSAAIGPCCYEVGPEVVRAVGAAFARTAEGRITVDLRAAARARLEEAGIPADRIGGESACTACRRDLWFSHRAGGGRPTGRHALVAWRG